MQGLYPTVRVFEVSSGKCLAMLNPSLQLGASALAISADGERLAVCGDDPDTNLTIYKWKEVRKA